jgi:hypothetical protein
MEVVSDFGLVTGCHKGDVFMAQATLASMRHFCPDVPIALTVDGDFDVSHLVRQYGVIPIRVDDVPSPEMRKLAARSMHAKHIPMWAGPFEFYVWLDADAIVWGDILPHIRRDVDFHIFRSENDAVIPADADTFPNWLSHYYFDPVKLRGFDPDFRWQENKYFCPGVFAAKRNAIPFHDYAKALAWEKSNPGTFQFGDMGIVNYLVYAMARRGDLKIAISDLQDMWVHNGNSELIADCQGAGWHFPHSIRRPRVAHFCGRKPHIFDRKSYSRPFTIARLEHYRPTKGNLGAWLHVLTEEASVISGKLKSRAARILKPTGS